MERWNPTPQEIAEIRERVYLLSTKKGGTLSGEDRRTLSDVSVLLLRLYEHVTSEDKAWSGHAVLRKLLPDAGPRRAFVAQACGREMWDAADLICAVNDTNRGKKPVNVTPEEAALVRAFVESI